MENKDWLKNLKQGDSVIVKSRYRKTLSTIDKITPTGRIKIGTSQYKDGYLMGGNTWDHEYLIEASEEEIVKLQEEIERRNLVNEVRNINTNKLSLDQLRRIKLIFDESIK